MSQSSTLWGYPVDTLGLLVSFGGLILITFGVVVAVVELAQIRKQQYFEAYASFMEKLEENREHRERLFTQFVVRDDYSKASPKDVECATQVINFLNRTAMLIYEGRLPCRIVFRLYHTGIIRCWHQLRSFAEYNERMTGGRYARLVGQLAERAKRFHDVRPLQRGHPIYLYDDAGKRLEIYRTRVSPGPAGLWQKLIWRIRWICRFY